ncbi:hypothetical protein LXL04_015248 [Taraxacum kok-saghyz]
MVMKIDRGTFFWTILRTFCFCFIYFSNLKLLSSSFLGFVIEYLKLNLFSKWVPAGFPIPGGNYFTRTRRGFDGAGAGMGLGLEVGDGDGDGYCSPRPHPSPFASLLELMHNYGFILPNKWILHFTRRTFNLHFLTSLDADPFIFPLPLRSVFLRQQSVTPLQAPISPPAPPAVPPSRWLKLLDSSSSRHYLEALYLSRLQILILGNNLLTGELSNALNDLAKLTSSNVYNNSL